MWEYGLSRADTIFLLVDRTHELLNVVYKYARCLNERPMPTIWNDFQFGIGEYTCKLGCERMWYGIVITMNDQDWILDTR